MRIKFHQITDWARFVYLIHRKIVYYVVKMLSHDALFWSLNAQLENCINVDTPRTPNGIEAKNYLHRLFHKTIGKNGIGKKEQEMEFKKLNKQPSREKGYSQLVCWWNKCLLFSIFFDFYVAFLKIMINCHLHLVENYRENKPTNHNIWNWFESVDSFQKVYIDGELAGMDYRKYGIWVNIYLLLESTRISSRLVIEKHPYW